MSIKDITTIQTGFFAKPTGTGDLVYLQSRDFDENGQLLAALQPDLLTEGVPEKHLLKQGDVLFAAKGTKNFAAVYEKHNAPAVASTSFFVIRLTGRQVLPEYLAWFLNSATAQKIMKAQAIGTSIPSISKQVLENLIIPIPDLQAQQKILRINWLRLKEKALKLKIEALREKQIQQTIFNAIQ